MPYAYGATIEHEFDGVKLNIWLTFRHPMNQNNEPALNKWTLTVDTVDKAISDSDWIDEFTLWLESVATVAYPDRVLLAYTGTDENLETTWGKNWEPWGDTLSTDIGKGKCCEDRGDPNAYDYQIGAFQRDGNWHDLDLSAIVPEYAKAVAVTIKIQATTLGKYILFRKNGNANAFNVAQTETQIANGLHVVDLTIFLDTDRVCEYNALAGLDTRIDMTVKGWWF